MTVTIKKIAIIVLSLYILVTLYSGYSLFSKPSFPSRSKIQSTEPISDLVNQDGDWNPWGEELENVPVQSESDSFNFKELIEINQLIQNKNKTDEIVVEIWGKAAIGLYLWEHIFNSKLKNKLGGLWQYGFKKIENMKFKFRTGPGIVPSKVPWDTQYLVLVLNGRSEEKIEAAKLWLDFLNELPQLKKTAVLLLGSEQCHNEWLETYMIYNDGPIHFVFLVYDSPRIDNKYFFQWPLGVATYRNFPKLERSELALTSLRRYKCNFVGTIYKNSSREQLLNILQQTKLNDTCFVNPRFVWQEKETEESSKTYLESLLLSDLTLSPVGQNTECYRIYEALSFGSVPIVEDVMTPGICGKNPKYAFSKIFPLRILKEYKAPVIYIKDWSNLSDVLKNENALSEMQLINRREHIVQWYENFKNSFRDLFVKVVKEHFVIQSDAK